jgi:hypothetical protein
LVEKHKIKSYINFELNIWLIIFVNQFHEINQLAWQVPMPNILKNFLPIKVD